jgi:hypothetical protein
MSPDTWYDIVHRLISTVQRRSMKLCNGSTVVVKVERYTDLLVVIQEAEWSEVKAEPRWTSNPSRCSHPRHELR